MRRITLCNTGCSAKAVAAVVAAVASASITSQRNVVSNNFHYYSARRALTMKLIHTEEIPNANNTSQRSSKEDRHIAAENINYNKEENINSKSTHYYDGSISGNSSSKIGKKTNNYSSYTNSKVIPYHKVSRGRLAIIRPDLIDEWIPELNAVDVTSVQCSSNVSVWWRCKMCKSKYSAAVRERVVKESRCCPYCHGTGKLVDVSDNKSKDNKLEEEDHQHLVEGKERTFTDNNDTSKSISDEVKTNAEEEVKTHASTSNVESELTNELSSKENAAEKPFVSLAMSHPHLIKYWNVNKNGTRTPEMFNANSVESVWWTTPFPLDHNSITTNKKDNTEKTNEEKVETSKEAAQFVTFRRPIASFVIDQMSLQEKLWRSAVLEEQLLDIIKNTASLAISSSLEEKPELCEEEKNELKETSNLLDSIYKQYAERNDTRSSGKMEYFDKDNIDRSELDSLGTNVLHKEHSNIIDWWSKQHTHDASHQEHMPQSSSVSDPHGKTKKQTTNSILHADELCFVNLPQDNKRYTSRVRGAIREELLNQYVQCLASLEQNQSLLKKENGSYDVNVPLLLLLANSELSNIIVRNKENITKNSNDDDDSSDNNISKSHINVMSKIESALQSIFTKQNKSSDVNVLYNSESMSEAKETQSEKARSAMSFTSLKLPNAATLHRSFPQLPSSLFNFTPSSSSPSSAMPTEQFAFPSTSSLPPESSVTSGKTLLSHEDMSNRSSSEVISDIINAMDSSDSEKKQHRSGFALINENDEACNKYPQLRKWMPRLFDKSLFTEDAPVETIFAQQRRQPAQQQQQQGSRLTDDALDEFTNSVTSTSYMQYQQQQQQRSMNRRGKNFILFSDPAEMWDEEPLLAEYHRATFVSEHDPRIKFYHDAEEGDIDLASQLRVSGLTNDSAGAENVQTKVYDKRSLVGDAMAALGSNPTLDDDLKALSYVREVMQEMRYPNYRSINIRSIQNEHDDDSGEGKSSISAGPRRTQGKPRTFRLQLPAAPLPVSLQTLEAPREPRKVARRKKRASDHEETDKESSSNNEKDEVS